MTRLLAAPPAPLLLSATTASTPRIDSVVCCDATALFHALPDASADAIITDPPYPKEFLPLYEMLAREAARVLKPGGSLLAMCGQSWLPVIYETMSRHIRYHWTICYLTMGATAQQWDRKVNPFWKPVLWFVNGEYTGPWVGDIVRSPGNDKAFHEWGQSVGGMTELIRRFTRPDDLIVEPFVGGGTTVIAARTLGRRYVACDIAQDNVDKTLARLAVPFTRPFMMFDEPQPIQASFAQAVRS